MHNFKRQERYWKNFTGYGLGIADQKGVLMKKNRSTRSRSLFLKLPAVLIIVLLLQGWSAKPAPAVAFPLHLSPDGRYLTDQHHVPFLIREISAWGLIQALSEKQESAFIDSVSEKGFNTLLVNLISFDTRFAGHPPDWQGIPPFSRKWDFSTYNPAYFDHADRFLQMAARKGMLVLLVPCYLGYKGDKNQGWWDELLSPENSPRKSFLYGEYLGKRYRDFTNIIWVAGGDNNGEGPLFIHMNNIISGIRKWDKHHLWTGHFDSSPGTNWSTGNPLYAKYMDLDGLYDFTESSLGNAAPQYKTELMRYLRGKMIFQLDQSYEHDIPHVADNENHQWIRRKNYDGLLSGCAGTSFSPGRRGNQCYTFLHWRPLMNTQGMKEMAYCFRVFRSRPWYRLVPDTSHDLIKHGRGVYGSLDYVCAAGTPGGDTYMAYLPRSRTVTMDLSHLSKTSVRAWWYNPRDGHATMIGVIRTDRLHNFTPKSEGDWLLVLDKSSLNLPVPGFQSE